jgi:hypothetical protein
MERGKLIKSSLNNNEYNRVNVLAGLLAPLHSKFHMHSLARSYKSRTGMAVYPVPSPQEESSGPALIKLKYANNPRLTSKNLQCCKAYNALGIDECLYVPRASIVWATGPNPGRDGAISMLSFNQWHING